jgi:MoaA/NifB/PqqE/SkfB family radical SAM enzyme
MKTPISCNIETNWNCNLNCSYCNKGIFNKKDNCIMDINTFVSILDKFRILEHVSFNCGGDPLTNPYFFDMLTELTNRKIKIKLTTNGLLLDKVNIKKIPDNCKIEIAFYIESPEKDIFFDYKKINLDKLLCNLDCLNKLRPDIKISLQPIIMKDSLSRIDRIIPIAKKYNAEVNPIYPISYYKETEDSLSPFSDTNFEKIMDHLYSISDHFGVNITTKPRHPLPKSCDEPSFLPTIASDGTVYACKYAYKVRSNNSLPKMWFEYYDSIMKGVPQEEYNMGNILNETIEKIWKGSNYRKLRDILEENKLYEKIRPFNKDQYSMYRLNNKLECKFDYCKTCLWRWCQAC